MEFNLNLLEFKPKQAGKSSIEVLERVKGWNYIPTTKCIAETYKISRTTAYKVYKALIEYKKYKPYPEKQLTFLTVCQCGKVFFSIKGTEEYEFEICKDCLDALKQQKDFSDIHLKKLKH